jgi:hypothetical protein
MATAATGGMEKARERAVYRSVQSVRQLEAALQHALGAGELKGMPNIGSGTIPMRAVRIRGKRPWQRIAAPGRGWSEQVLCLNSRGQLVMVRRGPRGAVSERRVDDDELQIRDAEKFAEVLGGVLDAHLAKAKSRTKTFGRLERFSDKIERILKEDE